MVLIVDDNHYMRTIIATMLRAMGIIEIREASDGAEALETVRDWRPDLVITDLVMPTLDGLEFTHMLRNAPDSPSPFVPIIMMTGHSDRKKVIAARDAGVHEVLVKPITAKALTDRLRAVIEIERPWIKAPGYSGPCRRRVRCETHNGPWRRKTDLQVAQANPIQL